MVGFLSREEGAGVVPSSVTDGRARTFKRADTISVRAAPANRAGREALASGDLGAAQPVEVTQADRAAVGFGQRVQRVEHLLVELEPA